VTKTSTTSLYAISGVYDLIVVVTADSTERVNELLDRTMSSIILAAKVER
jgi:hypothetical protein